MTLATLFLERAAGFVKEQGLGVDQHQLVYLVNACIKILKFPLATYMSRLTRVGVVIVSSISYSLQCTQAQLLHVLCSQFFTTYVQCVSYLLLNDSNT